MSARPPADTAISIPPKGAVPAIKQIMMPRDTNANGTIFGGVIMSQIDLAAAVEAHRWHPGRLVTVAMDKVEFHRPVHVGDLVSFYTQTLRTGNSSVSVRVDVWAQRRGPEIHLIPVTRATVTMVAIDDAGNSTRLSLKDDPLPLY
jgi:acyl-CoA thioesterase YciA